MELKRGKIMQQTSKYLLLTKVRSSRSQMFFKIGVLKNFANFTPTQAFSCEICKIFKSTFFYRTPPVAASASCSSKSTSKFCVLDADLTLDLALN